MGYYQFASLLAASIIVALASLRLHSKERSTSSLLLCAFAPLAIIYHVFSFWLFSYFLNGLPSWMSNWFVWITIEFLPPTFVLIASGLFFMAVRRQDRPN